MTYNVFGGTLSLTQSINQRQRRQGTEADLDVLQCCGAFIGCQLLA